MFLLSSTQQMVKRAEKLQPDYGFAQKGLLMLKCLEELSESPTNLPCTSCESCAETLRVAAKKLCCFSPDLNCVEKGHKMTFSHAQTLFWKGTSMTLWLEWHSFALSVNGGVTYFWRLSFLSFSGGFFGGFFFFFSFLGWTRKCDARSPKLVQTDTEKYFPFTLGRIFFHTEFHHMYLLHSVDADESLSCYQIAPRTWEGNVE